MFNQISERLKQSESYISMGLGILVVLVIGLLIYRNFSQINRPKTPAITENKETVKVTPAAQKTPETVQSNFPAKYTVVDGDDLWVIADKFYKDPYKWTEIAKANNLDDPNVIHPGNVLNIPKAEISPLTAGLPKTGIDDSQTIVLSANSNAIAGTTYVIQKGDDLWDISVRAYGDGFQIAKIIKANNISDPGLIFAGNVLTIPR